MNNCIYRTKYFLIKEDKEVKTEFLDYNIDNLDVHFIIINLDKLQGTTFSYQYLEYMKKDEMEVTLHITKKQTNSIVYQHNFNIYPLNAESQVYNFVPLGKNLSITEFTEMKQYFIPRLCLIFGKSQIETIVDIGKEMQEEIIYDFTKDDVVEVQLGVKICDYIIPLCKISKQFDKYNQTEEEFRKKYYFQKVKLTVEVEEEILTILQNYNRIPEFDTFAKTLFIFFKLARKQMVELSKQIIEKENLKLTNNINTINQGFYIVSQYKPTEIKNGYYIKIIDQDQKYKNVYLFILQKQTEKRVYFDEIVTNSNHVPMNTVFVQFNEIYRYSIGKDVNYLQIFVLDQQFGLLTEQSFEYKEDLEYFINYGSEGQLLITDKIDKSLRKIKQRQLQPKLQVKRLNINGILRQVPLQPIKLHSGHQKQLLQLLGLNSLEELKQYTQRQLEQKLCEIMFDKLLY